MDRSQLEMNCLACFRWFSSVLLIDVLALVTQGHKRVLRQIRAATGGGSFNASGRQKSEGGSKQPSKSSASMSAGGSVSMGAAGSLDRSSVNSSTG